jgi:hypothetical protein
LFVALLTCVNVLVAAGTENAAGDAAAVEVVKGELGPGSFVPIRRIDLELLLNDGNCQPDKLLVYLVVERTCNTDTGRLLVLVGGERRRALVLVVNENERAFLISGIGGATRFGEALAAANYVAVDSDDTHRVLSAYAAMAREVGEHVATSAELAGFLSTRSCADEPYVWSRRDLNRCRRHTDAALAQSRLASRRGWENEPWSKGDRRRVLVMRDSGLSEEWSNSPERRAPKKLRRIDERGRCCPYRRPYLLRNEGV